MYYVLERNSPRYTTVFGGGIGRLETAKAMASARADQTLVWSDKSEETNRYHAKSSDGRLFEIGERYH